MNQEDVPDSVTVPHRQRRFKVRCNAELNQMFIFQSNNFSFSLTLTVNGSTVTELKVPYDYVDGE